MLFWLPLGVTERVFWNFGCEAVVRAECFLFMRQSEQVELKLGWNVEETKGHALQLWQ